MHMNTEAFQAASVLLGFCARLLYASLSEEDLALLKDQAYFLHEEPFSTVAPQAAGEIARTVQNIHTPEELYALYHELKQDYTYVFYEVSLSKLSPYESVWRTSDQTLLGPTTLEVRGVYKSAGFELALPQQPDDHIGAELDFLACMFARAVQQPDTQQAARDLELARSFVSDHVLAFGPDFFTALSHTAHTDFYKALGKLSGRSLEAVAQLLDVHI